MASIVVVDREGNARTVTGEVGVSVMDIIRENGFDELAAICGGCCSCATCHVYVAPEFEAMLPPISADENDLLDSSSFRNGTSRLSCQIRFSEALDGVTVTIAPED